MSSSVTLTLFVIVFQDTIFVIKWDSVYAAMMTGLLTHAV